jgi:hypothetical protein
MNKRIITGCIFLLTYTILFAQTNIFEPEFSFGINAGTTLSNVSFVRNKGGVRPQKMFLQHVGGGSIRYISEKNFGLQGELNYSQRGWSEDGGDDFPGHKYAYSLGYLEAPLFTHMYFNTGKRGRIIFNLGPQISFLVNEGVSESDIRYPPPTMDEEKPDSNEDFYYGKSINKKFDWGLCGGAGFELRTGFGSFVLDGRYYFGLSDIFNNSKAEFSRSSNRIISIKLTYFYRK